MVHGVCFHENDLKCTSICSANAKGRSDEIFRTKRVKNNLETLYQCMRTANGMVRLFGYKASLSKYQTIQ